MTNTLLRYFFLSVRAVMFRHAVTPVAEARNALVAHATPLPGKDSSYPSAVQALLNSYDAEISAVAHHYFGPSHLRPLRGRTTRSADSSEYPHLLQVRS